MLISFSSHQQNHHHLISMTMPTLLLRISIISHILHTILYFLPKKLRSLLPNSPASNCHREAQVADRPSTTELDRVFRTFDRNGDGRITKEELTESLENLGIFISDRDMTSMIGKIDVDGDGCIDVEEFRTLYKGMMEMKEGNEKEEEEDVREAFEVFDVDGDGYITAEELRSVLSSLGLERGRTAEEYRRMIGRVDGDGDGRVSYKEFREMMKGGGLAAMA